MLRQQANPIRGLTDIKIALRNKPGSLRSHEKLIAKQWRQRQSGNWERQENICPRLGSCWNTELISSSWPIDHFYFHLDVWCGITVQNEFSVKIYRQQGRNPICDNHRDFFPLTASACISPTCRKKVSTNDTAAKFRTGVKSNIWTSLRIKV